jgi:hypothetical protein
VLGFLFQVLVFLLVKLPVMLLVGVIKLVVLPFRLVAFLVKAFGMLKYVAFAAALFAVARRVLGALEARGQSVSA